MTPTSPIPSDLLDDRFPDWWRALGVHAGGHVQARKDAINELMGSLKRGQLADAVAYAHGDNAAGEELIEFVRTTARTFDDSFAGDTRDAEPAAMVSAALAHHLAKYTDHEDSVLISELALAAQWRGLTPVINGQSLPEYARLALEFATASTRGRPSFKRSPSAEALLAKEFKGLEDIPDAALRGSNVSPHVTAHRKALVALAKRIDFLGAASADEQRLVREQISLHTWLLEEWCATANRAWGEVDPAAVPVAAALELAKITAGVVPSTDAEVALASTIVKAGGDPATMASPVQVIDAGGEMLKDRLGPPPRDSVFPIAAAHARKLAGGSWKQAARHLVGTGKRTHLSIASETYHELLALRGLDE